MALLVLLVTASTARCIGLWFASEDSGSSQQTIGRRSGYGCGVTK